MGRLFDLAYCCRLYGALDRFDAATSDLRAATGRCVDPGIPEHRSALFVWLRRWGCRQFVERDEAVAAESLAAWWRERASDLPGADTSLDELTEDELDRLADAYADLRDRQASWQELESGRVAKSYGPTGAAKALYATRPDVCSPCDEAIREALGLGGEAHAYRRRLEYVRALLEEVRGELGPNEPIANVPTLLGRPYSSPVKLVDEHDWVRYSKGFEPPAAETVDMWARWASKTAVSNQKTE